MKRLACVLALGALSLGLGPVASAGEEPDGRLNAVVEASLGVEDVQLSTEVVRRLAGTKLRLRSGVRQTPDGASMRAHIRTTESAGRFRRQARAQMVVVDGEIFVRADGRWREVEDTSPHFSYDEALELLKRTIKVERLSPNRYRGSLVVARRHAAPEPLNLLDERQRREATVELRTDAQHRLRQLDVSTGGGGSNESASASLKVVAFNQGLQVSAPKR